MNYYQNCFGRNIKNVKKTWKALINIYLLQVDSVLSSTLLNGHPCIEQSNETGIHLSKLKHAKVIAVFKSVHELYLNNSRPISHLSIFNRIFEKPMYNRLTSFLDKHNISCHHHTVLVFGKNAPHSMHSLIMSTESRIISIRSYSPVAFLFILKRYFTQSTTQSYCKNSNTTESVEQSRSGYLNDRQPNYLGRHSQLHWRECHDLPQVVVSHKSWDLNCSCCTVLVVHKWNQFYTSSEKLSFFLFAVDTNLLYGDKSLRSPELTINAEELRNEPLADGK